MASIRRVDRDRAVNVTASVDPNVTSAGCVIADLNARILPELLARHPGVFYTFEGMMAEQRDVVGGLQRGFVLALLMISSGSSTSSRRPPGRASTRTAMGGPWSSTATIAARCMCTSSRRAATWRPA